MIVFQFQCWILTRVSVSEWVTDILPWFWQGEGMTLQNEHVLYVWLVKWCMRAWLSEGVILKVNEYVAKKSWDSTFYGFFQTLSMSTIQEMHWHPSNFLRLTVMTPRTTYPHRQNAPKWALRFYFPCEPKCHQSMSLLLWCCKKML